MNVEYISWVVYGAPGMDNTLMVKVRYRLGSITVSERQGRPLRTYLF